MISTNTRMTAARRGLYGIGAGGLLTGIATVAAGASVAIMAPANAIPAPETPDQCSVSGIATTTSSVSASMGSYLQAHPDTDKALTDIAKQSPEQAPQAYHVYFTENPQVAEDLEQIQQPVSALSQTCHTQVVTDVITSALDAV